MRFWDASALVPLLIGEPTSGAAETEHAADQRIVTWWGTIIECGSALARREREGLAVDTGRERLDMLASSWVEVQPTADIRQVALRLVRVHELRAADALQLAAAISTAATAGDLTALPFVTLDVRLAAAAKKEGFRVISPGI